MTGEPTWTVLTSPEVDETIRHWAEGGGELAERAAKAQHLIDMLEIDGNRALDSHPIRGVRNLWRIRCGKVRLYYDTAPGHVIAVGVPEFKNGENKQSVYQLYARKVAEFKATIGTKEQRG